MEYKIKYDFLLGEKRINKDDNWNTLKPGFYHVNLWGGSTHPDNGYPQESGLGILIADNYLQICLLEGSLMYARILYEGEWQPWKANS